MKKRLEFEDLDFSRLSLEEIEEKIMLRLEYLNGTRFLNHFLYSGEEEARLFLIWLNALEYDSFGRMIGRYLDLS